MSVKIRSRGKICPEICGTVDEVLLPEHYLDIIERKTIPLWDKKFPQWKTKKVVVMLKEQYDITVPFYVHDGPCNECYENQFLAGIEYRKIAFPEDEIEWIN